MKEVVTVSSHELSMGIFFLSEGITESILEKYQWQHWYIYYLGPDVVFFEGQSINFVNGFWLFFTIILEKYLRFFSLKSVLSFNFCRE